jgi:hypothetical protein
MSDQTENLAPPPPEITVKPPQVTKKAPVNPAALEHAIHPHAKALPATSAFPAFYKKASLGFLGMSLVGLGLVVYAVMGSARVIVMAKPESINKEFAIDLSPKPGADDVLGLATEAESALERSFPVTESLGVKKLGRATVRVKIASSMSVPQTLIEKTRIVTPTGVQFRLTSQVTIPARGSSEVEAIADEAGEHGLVGLATFTIPGLRTETRKLFIVTAVTEPMAKEETVTAGTTGIPDNDLQAAGAVLKEELQKTLTEAMRTAAKADGLAEGAEIVSFADAQITTNRTPGAPEFTANLRQKGTAVFYDKAGLIAMVKERLKKELPAEREVRGLDEQALTVTVEKVEANGNATVRVHVTAEAALTSASPALSRQKLVGIKREAAIQYLQALDGVNSADIIIRPVWSTRMPGVPGRIEMEVR